MANVCADAKEASGEHKQTQSQSTTAAHPARQGEKKQEEEEEKKKAEMKKN